MRDLIGLHPYQSYYSYSFYFGHSNECEMVSLWFYFRFPWRQTMLGIFHFYIAHLISLCVCEISVQVLVHFLGVLLLCFKSSVCILGTCSLSDLCIVNIFFHSCFFAFLFSKWCLFKGFNFSKVQFIILFNSK